MFKLLLVLVMADTLDMTAQQGNVTMPEARCVAVAAAEEARFAAKPEYLFVEAKCVPLFKPQPKSEKRSHT